jgi:hypothetical protein
MAITINSDRIQIGNKFLVATPTGLTVEGGNFTARSLVQGADGAQGNVYGFTSTGANGPTYLSSIDRFPFTTDGDATTSGVATITGGTYAASGNSSRDSGFITGGVRTGAFTLRIERFSFTAPVTSTNTGNLSGSARGIMAGGSSSVNGYTSSGWYSPGPSNRIDKFPFSTASNATNIGTLAVSTAATGGISGPINGYVVGGFSGPTTIVSQIQKYSFSTDTNAATVAQMDTPIAGSGYSGVQSGINGYFAGSTPPITPGIALYIYKFPFASDTTGANIGNLVAAAPEMAGSSSQVSGYMTGYTNPTGTGRGIQKFPFSTDSNATSVGSLTVRRERAAGHQY